MNVIQNARENIQGETTTGKFVKQERETLYQYRKNNKRITKDCFHSTFPRFKSYTSANAYACDGVLFAFGKQDYQKATSDLHGNDCSTVNKAYHWFDCNSNKVMSVSQHKLRGGSLELTSLQPITERTMRNRIADVRKLQPELNRVSDDMLRAALLKELNAEIWINKHYQVAVYRGKEADELVHIDELKGRCMWLSIKRRDKKPVNNWQDFQTIKNVLSGEDCDAIQIYPAERHLVNTANQYHLICLPADEELPFGWKKRMVNTSSGLSTGGARQDYSGS
jgi:hypothetical protein